MLRTIELWTKLTRRNSTAVLFAPERSKNDQNSIGDANRSTTGCRPWRRQLLFRCTRGDWTTRCVGDLIAAAVRQWVNGRQLGTRRTDLPEAPAPELSRHIALTVPPWPYLTVVYRTARFTPVPLQFSGALNSCKIIFHYRQLWDRVCGTFSSSHV